jgi:hypothetical protein
MRGLEVLVLVVAACVTAAMVWSAGAAVLNHQTVLVRAMLAVERWLLGLQ